MCIYALSSFCNGFGYSEVVGEQDSGNYSIIDITYQEIYADYDSYQFGLTVCEDDFEGLNEYVTKWRSIIVNGCKDTLPSMACTESRVEASHSDKLSLVYAADLLPYHIFASGYQMEALDLLLDLDFVRHRFTTYGYLQTTIRHLRDTKFIMKKWKWNDEILQEESNETDFVDTVIEDIHQIILEIIEDKKTRREISMTKLII